MNSQIALPHRPLPMPNAWSPLSDRVPSEGGACVLEIGAMCSISADELLRRLADGLNDVFFCVDLHARRWTYLSEGYERIWGRPRESLFMDPGAWRGDIDPDDAPRVMQVVDACHSAGERYEIEFRIKRPDGTKRWVRVRGVPVVDDRGTVLRVVGHAEDRSRFHDQDNCLARSGRDADPRCARATERIRVVVAEGRPLVRHGLSAMLNADDGMCVVASAECSNEALAAWRLHHPDVLLLDQALAPLGASGLLREIRVAGSDTRAILIGRNDRECDVSTGLRAGARAFLLPTTSEEEVLRCIRTVHAGRSYVSQSMAELMAAHIASDPLTAREVEILGAMARGQSNKQIANVFSISESTVKSHVRRILEKTQASTRGEAAAIGLRRGLIELAS